MVPGEHGSCQNTGNYNAMTDLIYLAATVGFFALSALYVRFCGSL